MDNGNNSGFPTVVLGYFEVIELLGTLSAVEREHQAQAARFGDTLGYHQAQIEDARRQRQRLVAALSDMPAWRRATGEHAA